MHFVATKGQEHQVVERRSLTIYGFRPRGEPEWWPGVDAKDSALGADSCELFRTSKIRPGDVDVDVDEKDLTNLKALKANLDYELPKGTDDPLAECAAHGE